ncbi:putative fluoride ion transporter CrcB [Rosa chinensis]|uniref:Putative fluoride ion transporter CrcB n=1 Tax=Rosa chinensis TaxID=74649 RepID=A0A2P6PRX7_ROSCH|nr:fluoride export protein 1 isoform X2 [Rosa chinensis]PRQ24690.1 putative fluoride ion transporter CrcB [Rosa chinensis]
MVMEGGEYSGTNDSELRASVSIDVTRSASSSLRWRSLSSLGAHPSQVDEDIESDSVSEVGDIGDRALHSNRYSVSGSFNFSSAEDIQLQSYGFWCHDPTASHAISTVSPLPEEIISPLSTDAIVRDEEKNQASTERIPKLLEYGSCMTHLAFFGILGVLTRYLLQKLFGPRVAGVTSDQTILYLDLPSNMVGSFLMGWCGVVFKADISYRSDFLAIGLTTGYLGSVTTFSGWNQKMLELSVEGHWVFAGLGFLIGLFLAAYSIIFGVETSKCFRQLLVRSSGYGVASSRKSWRVDSLKRHLAVLAVCLLLLAGLWSMSGILMRQEFNSSSSETQLWLACIIGPLGVWVRWFLARLNGRGLGKTGLLKWVPFGTLIANVSAACIMAALATVKREVNTKTCDIVATGIQFGFLGCLSTVSTFIAEFNAMRESKYPWRAYIYATVTICTSFCLGTLIYSVPVWAKGDN